MATRHVVVDGSNLATEGRSMPSLAQLDTAVREFLQENPDDMVTVVVDASFGHRIDPSEFKVFEEAEAAGELVSPPAGAIGRGDAFLLRIADKTGATVLSNDSFQEFHGDYEWLFERGRLIGGKPVPGVGWIFTPRTPVRGPRSREAVKEAKRKSKTEAESAVPGLDLAASRTRGKGKKTVERAIAVATEEAVAPKEKSRRRRKGGDPPADPVNDPLTFITFIAAHPLGAEVTATVESFASHGAFVECAGARCYVPLSAMGEPPPKSAREIFGKGQDVRLIVQALDPHRRGVELALPGYAKIAGAPTDETVEAEIGSGETDGGAPLHGAAGIGAPAEGAPPARRARKRAPTVAGAPLEPSPTGGEAAGPRAAPPAAPARRHRGAPPVVVPEPVTSEVVGAPAAGSTPARRRMAKAPGAVMPEDSEATGPTSAPPAAVRSRSRVTPVSPSPPETAVAALLAPSGPAEAVVSVPSVPAEAVDPAPRKGGKKAAPRSAPEASPAGPPATEAETATQPPAGAQKARRGRRSGGGPEAASGQSEAASEAEAEAPADAAIAKRARSRATAKGATPRASSVPSATATAEPVTANAEMNASPRTTVPPEGEGQVVAHTKRAKKALSPAAAGQVGEPAAGNRPTSVSQPAAVPRPAKRPSRKKGAMAPSDAPDI